MSAPFPIALVAPTASGKTDLAIALAKALDAEIFSIDSLSIYKHINIASAKPSPEQLREVKHYGIDVLEPFSHCSAGVFCDELSQALRVCKKPFLLIVGGSGFYLSCFYEGLSMMPRINQTELESINQRIQSLSNPYAYLSSVDSTSASSITPNDSYRIHKLLSIYFATNTAPSAYFATHTKAPIIAPPPIYTIDIPRQDLWNRIAQRTHAMLESNLIAEAKYLAQTYGEHIQPFKAIGLKETLQVLKGELDSSTLAHLITMHTRQLAKRQATYIRSKFPNAIALDPPTLYKRILKDSKYFTLQ